MFNWFRKMVFWPSDILFRLKYGFSRNDLYGLNISLANWLLPRLKYFSNHYRLVPHGVSAKKWDKDIQQILITLNLIKQEEVLTLDTDHPLYIEADKGARILGKMLMNIWE